LEYQGSGDKGLLYNFLKNQLAFTQGLIKQAHHQKKVYCEVKECKQTLKFLQALRKIQ
jgi:hypothetical protein